MSSPEDFVEAYAKGATKAKLEFTFDKIKELAIKLLNKNASFLDDPEIIVNTRKNYSSGEMKEYKKYVSDKKLRRLISFGLTLRKIEDSDKRIDFRNKILSEYKTSGLHIVQFVENSLLNELIAFSDKERISEEISDVLGNIERYVLFVQKTDDCEVILERSKSKVHSFEPSLFIISSKGSAVVLLRECEEKIKCSAEIRLLQLTV